MIPSRPWGWFKRWFAGHARKRLARTFASVRVADLSRARAALRDGAVVAVSNHTSWWDPLVILWLTEEVLRADCYAMMDAKNLRRLPFFGLVGAFGVDLDDPRDGALAMRYAARLLDRPGRAVWVFAQGRERPVSARPLGFLRGAAEVSRVAKAPTVPVALRYEFGGEERPTLFVSVGEPIAPSRDVIALRDAHEAAVTALLDALDADLREGSLDRYEAVIASGGSALGPLAERALVAMTRRRAGVPR